MIPFAPPEGQGLHLFAQPRPHILDPELEEEEPAAGLQDPGRLPGRFSAVAVAEVAEDVEGEDRIEGRGLEGELDGVRCDEFRPKGWRVPPG